MIRTFGVAKNTVLLLASVPAGSAIINTASDQASVVWLGSDPNTKANVGFPLNALSSMEMAKTGPLYAVLDPAATDTVVSVLVGDDLNGYDNPIALASAVAAALAVSGIPSVALSTLLGTFTLNAVTTIDIKKYASFTVENLNTSAGVLMQQYMVAGDPTSVVDEITWNAGPAYLTKQRNCYGLSLDLSCPTDPTTQVKVWGTNRSIVAVGDTTDEMIFVAPGTAVAVGANVIPTPSWNGEAGTYAIRFAATAPVTTGYFRIQDGLGNTMPLCETTELVAGVSAAKTLLKVLPLPKDAQWQYFCTGAAGGVVSINMVAQD